jgi:GGDEF domain-containing protein
MNTKNKIILSGIIITFVLLFSYVSIRFGMIEREYTDELTTECAAIATVLRAYGGDGPVEGKDLTKFFEYAGKKYENIAVLAVKDRTNRLLVSGRNEAFIDNEGFEGLIQGFSRGEFPDGKQAAFAVRYYSQLKYYVFALAAQDTVLLLAYPYRLSTELLVKLLLELALMAVLALMLTAALYIYLKKTGRVRDEAPYRVIHLMQKERPTEEIRETPAARVEADAAQALHDFVFEVFSRVSAGYGPGSIALYVMNAASGELEKMYELSGSTFLKIDSADFERIDLTGEMGEELRKSSILMLDRSRRIIIPLSYRGSLLGTIVLARETEFRGPEVRDICGQAGALSKAVSDFLVLSDVVVDAQTGLFSKPYFQLKYDEYCRAYEGTGTEFAVLLLAPFGAGSPADEAAALRVFKTAAYKTAEVLGRAATMSRFDDHMAILLPGSGETGVRDTAERVIAALRDTRVKIGKKEAVEITPLVGIAAAGTEGPGGDTFGAALRNLNNSKARGETILFTLPGAR